MRSSTPPWPGSSVPESFTLRPRFMVDSTRSPSCAATLMHTAKRTTSQTGARKIGALARQSAVEGAPRGIKVNSKQTLVDGREKMEQQNSDDYRAQR